MEQTPKLVGAEVPHKLYALLYSICALFHPALVHAHDDADSAEFVAEALWLPTGRAAAPD